MTGSERILVMAHGHPDLITGGGEIAAHGLYQAYRENPGVEACWFLARANEGQGPTGRISRHRRDEYLWDQSLRDFFFMEAENKSEVLGYFSELVARLRPTVVHTHHYFQLGLEYLKAIKDVDPTIRTVLTLHEYMAICPNFGLMLSPGSLRPCRSGDALSHVDCAPERASGDIWLRKHRFDRYFDFVDHFIAPSAFLRDRYVEWGLDPSRISVIENGQPDRTRAAPRGGNSGQKRNRFGFFGQINPYKGLDVVLDGLNLLGAEARAGLIFEIHGANLERQDAAFRAKIDDLATPLIKEGSVRFIGPYTPDELAGRMAAVDWVVVPSIWYENSPLVIQEAFAIGRPVIATDFGALREKVTNGVTGVTVPRGNPHAWADEMLRVSNDPELWDRLYAALPTPMSLTDCAVAHLEMIGTLERGE